MARRQRWTCLLIFLLAHPGLVGQTGGVNTKGLSNESARRVARLDLAWERNKKLPGTYELLQDLKSCDVGKRRAAAQWLTKLEPDFNVDFFDKIEAALTRALEDPDARVGELAVRAFARIRCQSGNGRLFELLNSDRSAVRWRAVSALRVMASQAFHAADEVQILENPASSSAQRLRAIPVVAVDLANGYDKTLIARCYDDPSPKVRAMVMQSLGKGQCSGAFDVLVAGSRDVDPGVRKASIQAMYDTYDKRFLPTLRARQSDTNPEIRRLAAKLGKELARLDMSRGPAWPKKRPKYVDLKLGEFDICGIAGMSVFDPKRKLFFTKDGECDGAHLWVAMSSEPGAVNIPTALNDMVEAPIGDMKTGNGIGIGTPQSEVVSKLGKPAKVAQDHGRTVHEYVYRYREYTYVGTYAYRKGNVVAIQLSRSCPE